MKKIIAIFAFALMMVVPSQAQVDFGVRAGLNLTNMKLSGDMLSESNRAGFFVGPMVKVTVPVVGLSFDVAAVYDQRNAAINDNGYLESAGSKAIAIPVNVRYGVGLGSIANVFAFAGPQFSFNVAKDKTFAQSAREWKWNSSNVSINVGVGVTIAKHYEVRANYNIACGKTGELSVKNATDKAFDGKYNAWQVGVGYYF